MWLPVRRTPGAWILGLTSWRRIFAHDQKAAFLQSQTSFLGGLVLGLSSPRARQAIVGSKSHQCPSQLPVSCSMEGVLSQFFPSLPFVSNLSPVSFQLDPSFILDATSSFDHILVILINLIQRYRHASWIVINTIGFGTHQAIDGAIRVDNRLRSMTLEKGMKQR